MQLCYNGLVRKTSSILLAMLGLRAFALSVPELPRTDYADTEVSTNVTLTALFLCAWNCWVSERISELCAAWKRSSFVTRVVSVAFVGILMAYASTKPPENGQEGRYLCLVSSLPEGQSEVSEPDPHRGETILTREWNLPGAWQYSMRRQDFAGGFVFPYGTNHLACVHVSSQGSVRETRFSTNVIASCSFHARSPLSRPLIQWCVKKLESEDCQKSVRYDIMACMEKSMKQPNVPLELKAKVLSCARKVVLTEPLSAFVADRILSSHEEGYATSDLRKRAAHRISTLKDDVMPDVVRRHFEVLSGRKDEE